MTKIPPLCGLRLFSQGCEGLADEKQPILVSLDPTLPQYAVGKRICPECLCYLVTHEIEFTTNPPIRVYLGLEPESPKASVVNASALKPQAVQVAVASLSKEAANEIVIATRGKVRGHLLRAGFTGDTLEEVFEAIILALEAAFGLGEFEKIESLAQKAVQEAKVKVKSKKVT